MASQSGLKSEKKFLILSECRSQLLAQSLYQTCTQNLKENDPETLSSTVPIYPIHFSLLNERENYISKLWMEFESRRISYFWNVFKIWWNPPCFTPFSERRPLCFRLKFCKLGSWSNGVAFNGSIKGCLTCNFIHMADSHLTPPPLLFLRFLPASVNSLLSCIGWCRFVIKRSFYE